jgi:4-carboxymuconolactone decarboxylase
VLKQTERNPGPMGPSPGDQVSRIPLFSPEDMTAAQEAVYRRILAGPRTEVVGPLRAVLHVPELADRWQRLGEFLRFETSLPARLNELAILVTARRWNAQLEWSIHAQAGLAAGLAQGVVEQIRQGDTPDFSRDDEREVYEFTRSLQLTGHVPEEIYQAVWARWGSAGAVELSSVVGYYTLVAMTLNVHQVPMPHGTATPMPLSLGDENGEPPLSDLPMSTSTATGPHSSTIAG